MKIAKKISFIFLGSTLFIFIICIFFASWTLNNLKTSENKRIISRSNSIYNLYNSKVEEMGEISKNLKDTFMISHYIKNRKIENLHKEINKSINEYINKNDINYMGIIPVDSRTENDIKILYNGGVEDSFKKEIYKYSKSNSTISGTILFNDDLYVIHIESVTDLENKELGRLFLAKPVDNKFLEFMGDVLGDEVLIEKNFYPQSELNLYINKEKIPVYILVSGNNIVSYIGLDTIEDGKQVYLSFSEKFSGIYSNIGNISKILLVLLLIILSVNIITYIIVKNKLIKRIIKMNKDVNGIIESKKIDAHLANDIENDEISGLATDINKMIDNIREVNLNLDTSKAQYKELLKTMSNGLIYLKYEKDGKYKILEINDFAKKLLGLNIEKNYESQYLSGSKEIDILIKYLNKAIKSEKSKIEDEIKVNEKEWFDISYQFKKDGTILIVLNDITDLKRYSEEMSYLANYDTLTGVLNRHNIMKYIEKLTSEEKAYAIYFIDLDNFKEFNDTLGHNMGDQILCSISEGLNIICTDDIMFGRLGGDEFVVVKKGNNDSEEAEDLARVILEVLNSVISFNKLTFELSGSIGISYYPTHSGDMNEVIQYADIAMYKAKLMGGNNFQIFSEDMLEGVELQNRLKEAILKDEFEMYYQPIYDIKKGEVTGCEALIRWVSDEGIVPPDKFIPTAKKNGDIIEIDKLVFDKSFKYCKEILERNSDFTVSVNLSYKFLKQNDFLEQIKFFLEENKLDPHFLRVEITEDEFIEDMVGTSRLLNNLRAMGIRISLDDFGTGYSSFNYLKELPVDVIKIDRSIVSKVCEDEKSLNIVRTLIKLCHELNFSVICEGVECEDEFNLLKELSCDKIQGYYISKPLSGNKFKEFIR